MIDLNFKYEKTIDYFNHQINFTPDIAIVLGSGLGNFAQAVQIIKSFPTNEIPGYPSSTVEGHSGLIHFAEYSDKKILLFQGRIHLYEGYSISECVLPAFLTKILNCRNLLLTNAAGGINRNFQPGDLMLAESFNGINIKKELTQLIGSPTYQFKKNFVNFPSKEFSTKIKKAADAENVDLKVGVYHFTKGPTYETPAEVEMMRKFGSDAVGMSTVHEAVLAAIYGIEVASISCITNMAAGISERKLNHSEVTEMAAKVNDKFTRLVKKIVEYV
ncbi:MAG TPA: purine-nucleoside phosphorylase [Ignavibacteriaceae bacterium]|nr:purine-nucleoside phosphorylase [Ignavibacteriaceae bacterium]